MSKYGLPKHVCFDVRTTLCSKKVKYDVTLLPKPGHKRTSTKVCTIKEGMLAVIDDRVKHGVWTQKEVNEYMITYNPVLEKKFTFELACKIAEVTPEYVLSGQYMKDRYGKKTNNKKTVLKQENKKVVYNSTKQCKAKSLLEYLSKNPQWTMVANFPELEIYSEPYLFTNEYGVTCWTYHIRNTITKRELKPTTKSNSLYVNVGGIQKAIYKLAADTFIHNPYKKRDSEIVATQVHHINGNHNDNRLENLMHVTEKEHKAYHKELRKGKPIKRLSELEIKCVRALRDTGISYYTIAEKLGLSVYQVKSAVELKYKNIL